MRNLGLDLLRILAVFLVLGRHLRLPGEPSFLPTTWHRGGWIGVDLFFVLSGFLVSGLLFKEHLARGRVDIVRFLVRRGFKIYPSFWVLIAATIGVALWRGKTISGRVLAGELLFLQNYVGSLWGHTWSLAVEEHFYIGLALLFPVLLSVRNGRGLNAIPRLFLLVAAACLTMRLLTMGYVERYAHQRFLFPTHLRIDSLFFGVLLACLYHHRQLAERTRHVPAAVLVLAGVVLMAPPFAFSLSQHKWVSVLGVIPVYMGSGLLLLAAVRVERSSNRLLLGLGALGATSYPIYLWHMAVNYWGCELLDTVVGFHWFELYAVLYFAGSCAVGYTLSKAVEWPLLRLRDRLFPRAER